MIGRVLKRGKRVRGLLYYLYRVTESNKHVNPRVIAGWRDPARIEPPVRPDGRRDFRRLAELLESPLALLGDRAPKLAVWHCTLSVAPGDPVLGDGAMAAITEEVMHRTGLHERGREDQGVPWVAVRHADNHVHIVAVLVRVNGRPVHLRNDYYRIGEAMRWAEQEYGLQAVARADRTAAKRPSRAENEKAHRAGRREAPRVTLRRQVAAASAASRSEADFFASLKARGLAVRLRESTINPGEVTGYAVGLPGDKTAKGEQVWYGGGQLAADLTLPKLRPRWDSGHKRLSGRWMGGPAAKVALHREVAWCAAAARSESEFWAALHAAGLLVRRRTDPARPGDVSGYAVSLPGLISGRDKRPIWFSGGTLDSRLPLPVLRDHWRAGQPGIASGPDLFTGVDSGEIYAYAAHAAQAAAREIRSARPQLDTIWAAADLIAAGAEATGNHELLRAADGLLRAARLPWGRTPHRSPGGAMLRTASYFLASCRSGEYRGRATRVALINALTGLARAVAYLHAQQRRLAEAEASRGAVFQQPIAREIAADVAASSLAAVISAAEPATQRAQVADRTIHRQNRLTR